MPSRPRLDRAVFWLGLAFALGFLAVQSVFRIEQIRFLSGLTSMPADVAALPGTNPRSVVLPPSSVDALWWVMHTEAMLRDGDWRVRETTRDNAPQGREVHWSSGLMWALAALAWLIHLASGMTTVAGVQHAAAIVGPVLFAGFIAAFAWATARRWGGAAGGLLALAMATLAPLDEFFRAGEADHHGIVACFALGCVLAALAAGAGRVARPGRQEEAAPLVPGRASARRWMIASGLLGAAGLWVSAATMVPVLAGLAAGAFLGAWTGRRAGEDAASEDASELWRTWGRAGAAGSLAFYLLEYAPTHLGWRLEVNHPLYALAWIGGAEWLAALCAWAAGGRLAASRRAWARLALAAAAAAVLPVLALAGGLEFFVLRDVFLWRLHRDYIHEFEPLLGVLGGASWWQRLVGLQPWFLGAAPVLWLAWRRPTARIASLVVMVGAAVPSTALAFAQIRWMGVAQTIWLALALAGIVTLRRAGKTLPKWGFAGASLLAALGLLPYLAHSAEGWFRQAHEGRVISTQDSTLLVMRDVAWKLRRMAEDRPITVLSGPTTTTNLAYFGDMRGVGTLYWENIDGLKAAGAIYGAQDDDIALRFCLEHGITHVVIFSWDTFAEPYALLHHKRPKGADTKDCFVSALLTTKNVPVWLRPLPYTITPKIGLRGQWLHIFEVRPDQKPAEAFYHLGVYLNGVGRPEEGLDALLQSWRLGSGRAATGRELGLALIEAERVDEARKLAAGLPAPDRLQVEAAAGRRLAEAGRHAEAVAALREALRLAPTDREIVVDLAWLLAVSGDSTVRDGAEALRLMAALSSGGQGIDLRAVDALAAAYAETGDFDRALGVVEKGLAAARRKESEEAYEDFMDRQARYRQRLPYRVEAKRNGAATPGPDAGAATPDGASGARLAPEEAP